MSEFITHYGLLASLCAYGAGALLSVVFGVWKDDRAACFAAHVAAALGGLIGLAFGVSVIVAGQTFVAHFAVFGGFGESMFSIRVDALSALFVTIISTIVLAASLFGIGYQKQFIGIYRLGGFGFFYNAFIVGMILVVSGNDGILFLLAWETMAIASYFLVVFERREVSNIRAGLLYILISQMGAVFLFAALLLLYGNTGSWDFDVIRAGAGALPTSVQNTVLALALVGFASKAGVIPLHIWLPEAHPAAPSHVSALMSGVMIKTAIFMIVRFFIEFFPNVDASWGLLILVLGAISSILGVLYALSEHDIKRLLAFHSVENIGIILLGIGASIVFFAYNSPVLGIAALVAALYHTLNHALFKALLFLSAGSVVHATGTRNMEEYGGLLRIMPWTGLFFLIGAVAISGLPPFNGFVSEWLTFQALFAGIASLPLLAKIIFLAGASSLAFTGGLAAACFVKAFGATFLARPRGHARARAHQSSLIMHVGMALLAALVIVLGIGASAATPVLLYVAESVRFPFSGTAVQFVSPSKTLVFSSFSELSMWGVTLTIAGGILLAVLISLVARNRTVSIRRTWDCGAPLRPRMEITATGFSRSILTIFRGVLRPSIQTSIEYDDATTRYFPKARRVHMSLPDVYRMYLYQPVVALLERAARETRRVQTGNLNTYLLYMFATVIALLYWTLK